ncbi:hypothetical protein [Nitrososphaera sp.]|uniref:hypothetical protein n=1 Tax=Nitrososphaera sp. TaxID=1971748 RepID=UPI00184101A1|nr:hypothetical protein [Nitrososphaera sp.]NWG36117.1 hypothetical protein [Nitrososphaera sp.]
MDIIGRRPDDIGPATALNPQERNTLIELAKITKNDTFYDFGSGHGYLVFDVVRKTRAKKAVGIEMDFARFSRSVNEARRKLTRKQLDRTELYCADYFSYDVSDATVIYEGHERTAHEVAEFERLLDNGKKVRVVTVDLPLVGYRPVRIANHESTRFFVMRTPFSRYRVGNPDTWASYALGKEGAKIRDVFEYYDALLNKRGFTRRERQNAVRKLKSVVRSCF